MREGVGTSLFDGALAEVEGGEHGVARVAVDVGDAQQADRFEQARPARRSRVSLDDEGIPRQRGDGHQRQSPRGQDSDVAVHLGQYFLQAVFLADVARVGTAGGGHQIVDEVVVPARTGARHSHR